jgi:hypothetical protein
MRLLWVYPAESLLLPMHQVSLEPLAGGRPSWGWSHDMAADGSISLALRESAASRRSEHDTSGDMSCWAMPDAVEAQDTGKHTQFPTSRFKAGEKDCSSKTNAGSGAVAPECDSSWQSSQL